MESPDPEYALHCIMLSVLFVLIFCMYKTLPHKSMSTLTGEGAPEGNEMLSNSVIVSSQYQ